MSSMWTPAAEGESGTWLELLEELYPLEALPRAAARLQQLSREVSGRGTGAAGSGARERGPWQAAAALRNALRPAVAAWHP